MTEAALAQGATLTFGGSTVIEVTNIDGMGPENADVDVTSHSSLNRTREFIPGLIDPGEFTCELNFIPTDADHQALFDNANASAILFTAESIVLTFADPFGAESISVLGYVKSFKPHVPADGGALTATVVFRATGAITRGGGS